MLKQVYRGPLSETATVASKLGQAGELRVDTANGNIYKLCYFPTTGSFGHAVQWVTATTNPGYHVGLASITGVRCAGVNNVLYTASTSAAITSKTHASGMYAWVQCKGLGVCSVKASYAANLHLIPSTDGGVATSANTESCGNFRVGATQSSVTVGIQSIYIDLF